MGMSIEKIINTFDYIKHVGTGESEYKHCREEIALDEAVAILRKYQKIQKIVNKWHHDIEAKDFECMAEIAEVVEDGNDD